MPRVQVKAVKSYPSISPSVRSTEIIFLKENCEGQEQFEKDDKVRASHINPLGRSKPLPLVSDQVKQTYPKFSYDLTNEAENNTPLFHLALWIRNDNSCSESVGGYEAAIYDDILSLLWESPTARFLINYAASKDWAITVDALDDAAYDLDEDQRILTLNTYNLKLPTFEKSGYFRHALILALVKGMRDIWHIECCQPYKHGLTLESVLLLERVRAADCDVITLLTAWELRGEGTPEIWRHLLGAPEGDMAMRFTCAVERQPGKLFDGSALIEAFHGWFNNYSRVSACDQQTLDIIDLNLDTARQTKLYGKKKPTADFIESLSCLGDKRLYLKNYGMDILHDPHFAGLHDDVSHAYYLQIKRELETTMVGAVAFRDSKLAAKIFPEELV
jgi:hypothetical protein